MQEPNVLIIIPNYNGVSVEYKSKPIIKQCLDSLKKTSYRNYSVLVTDDLSTDNSVNYIKKNYPYVKIIKRASNSGYTENANTGLRYFIKNKHFDYALLLDSDTIIIYKNWLKELINLAVKEKDAGIVGCNLVYPDGNTQGNVTRFKDRFSLRIIGKNEVHKSEYNSIRDAQIVPGAMHLIKRSTLEKIGFLDCNFVNGYNDEDYCLRVKKSGLRVLYNGKVKVTHLQNFTIKNTNNNKGSTSKKYNSLRNSFYFLRKHKDVVGISRLPVWYLIYFLSGITVSDAKSGEVRLSSIRINKNIKTNVSITIKALIDSFRLKIPSNDFGLN